MKKVFLWKKNIATLILPVFLCIDSSTHRAYANRFHRPAVYKFSGKSYQGSKLHSSYVKFIPPYYNGSVYTSSIMGVYWDYYQKYSFSKYHKNRSYHGDPVVCVNYEANENGSVMGIFQCPLSFEPHFFMGCCGEKYAEFCCELHSSFSSSLFTLVVMGVFAICLVIVSFQKRHTILMYLRRTFRKKPYSGRVIEPTIQAPAPVQTLQENGEILRLTHLDIKDRSQLSLKAQTENETMFCCEKY